MSAHVIFCGPSTAGKTSLMLGLSQTSGEYNFTVDRTITTRSRRPNESDLENVFVTPDEFEQRRSSLLFSFQTYPTYEYGIDQPAPLQSKEARMRILMPALAQKFRSLVPEPTLICAILPHHNDPEHVFLSRDPEVDQADLRARVDRFQADKAEATACADLSFRNQPGLHNAVQALRQTILSHLCEVSVQD